MSDLEDTESDPGMSWKVLRVLWGWLKEQPRRAVLPMLTVVIVNHLFEHSLSQFRQREGEFWSAIIAHPAVEILLETVISVFVLIIVRFGAATVGRIGVFTALFAWLVVWLSFLPSAPPIDPQMGAAYAVSLGI